MLIQSIVRIVAPGAHCSHHVGRHEVYHTDSELVARELCATFNRCRFADNLGFHYEIEAIDEESPDRAPETAHRADAVCVPNCVFV